MSKFNEKDTFGPARTFDLTDSFRFLKRMAPSRLHRNNTRGGGRGRREEEGNLGRERNEFERDDRLSSEDEDEQEQQLDFDARQRARVLREHFRNEIIEQGIEESASDTFLDALNEMGLITNLIPIIEQDPQSPLPRVRIRTSSSENGSDVDYDQDDDEDDERVFIDIDIEMPGL